MGGDWLKVLKYIIMQNISFYTPLYTFTITRETLGRSTHGFCFGITKELKEVIIKC